MGRQKEIDGTRWIKFRVNEKMYEFIKKVSEEMGVTISETCRGAIQLFFMGIALGRFKGIENELKEICQNRGKEA